MPPTVKPSLTADTLLFNPPNACTTTSSLIITSSTSLNSLAVSPLSNLSYSFALLHNPFKMPSPYTDWFLTLFPPSPLTSPSTLLTAFAITLLPTTPHFFTAFHRYIGFLISSSRLSYPFSSKFLLALLTALLYTFFYTIYFPSMSLLFLVITIQPYTLATL